MTHLNGNEIVLNDFILLIRSLLRVITEEDGISKWWLKKLNEKKNL